jgi:hypothetical protein
MKDYHSVDGPHLRSAYNDDRGIIGATIEVAMVSGTSFTTLKSKSVFGSCEKDSP